nr:hypothetical protein [Sicyoidochytrium minutum DNA virus]
MDSIIGAQSQSSSRRARTVKQK